ncbi:MAG: NACHT domain-containing protein [Pseudanabaena sp. ELA607]
MTTNFSPKSSNSAAESSDAYDEAVVAKLEETNQINNSVTTKEIIPTGKQYRPWQWLKVWGWAQPLPLRDICIELDVYDKVPQWQSIEFNLMTKLYDQNQRRRQVNAPLLRKLTHQMADPINHDQWWEAALPQRLPLTALVTQHHHILLTGAAGSGKTASLRWLMGQCATGKLLKGCVPLIGSCLDLVSGKDAATAPSEKCDSQNPLYVWLKQYLVHQKFNDEKQIQLALSKGLFWLLIDELDDLPPDQQRHLIQQILQFQSVYPKVRIVIATRHSEIGQLLSSFMTITLAPLTTRQISNYVEKWFKATALSHHNHQEQTQSLINLIEQSPEIYSLVSHPLILGYMASRFEQNPSFGWDFYQEVVELLLWHWDHSKLLPSHEPLTSLSQQIEYLSYLAIMGREQYQHGWQGSKMTKVLHELINNSQRIRNSPLNPSTIASINLFTQPVVDSNLLIKHWEDSSLVMRVASNLVVFRYPLLQDYLAAHRLAHRLRPSIIKYILEHLNDRSWHGVIILITCLTDDPATLLREMKNALDKIINNDSHLQSFLMWINQQVMHFSSNYNNVSLRALYFDLELEKVRVLDRTRALDIAHARSLERAHLRAMGKSDEMETDIDIDLSINLALNLDLALYVSQHSILELACALNPVFKKERDHLLQSLPSPINERDKFPRWWQMYGLEWSKKLRNLIIQNRKSIQDWQFSESQEEVLRNYIQANLVFAKCLSQCSNLSQDVRRQMENTMLLPSGDFTILQP